MVVTTALWQYWHKQQYEEAVTEVCGLLDVKEEAFNSDQELLEAAGDVTSPISPTVETHDPNVENLALFGCSCCNRLAERFLRSDWRVSAHWCALARQLECGGTGDRWAMARFKRLFNAAEAMRLAGKDGDPGKRVVTHQLQASRRCLEGCEAIWLRWPSCTSSPESIYTCLAEVCWHLKDMDSVRSSCRKALSLFMSSERLTAAKTYACMFVLWVFQSAAMDVFSWREVRAALHCARDMFERLQAFGLPAEELRPHSRILKRLQRQGQVVPMAPLGLEEAQLELGLKHVETFDHLRQPSPPVTSEAAVMTEDPIHSDPPPPMPECCECEEIAAFLESLDAAEATAASRKQGCLDGLLSAAAAMQEEMGQDKSGGVDSVHEATTSPTRDHSAETRWKRRRRKVHLTAVVDAQDDSHPEEHPPPWLSVPSAPEVLPSHSHSLCERSDALSNEAASPPSAVPSVPRFEVSPPVASEETPVSPRCMSEKIFSRPQIVRKPAVPRAPRQVSNATRARRSMSCDRDRDRPPVPAKPRTHRSVSLHFEETHDQKPPPRERRKAPLPKWSSRPSSGYIRPAASLRPAIPASCRPVSGHSECSTNANVSCSSEATEVLSRPVPCKKGSTVTTATLSVFSTAPNEPVDVDAEDVLWAFRGIRRQVEPPHLHFGHIPRQPAFYGGS